VKAIGLAVGIVIVPTFFHYLKLPGSRLLGLTKLPYGVEGGLKDFALRKCWLIAMMLKQDLACQRRVKQKAVMADNAKDGCCQSMLASKRILFEQVGHARNP
jgi:hypothetical protein